MFLFENNGFVGRMRRAESGGTSLLSCYHSVSILLLLPSLSSLRFLQKLSARLPLPLPPDDLGQPIARLGRITLLAVLLIKLLLWWSITCYAILPCLAPLI